MATFRPVACAALLLIASCELLGHSAHANAYALHRRGDDVVPILLAPPAAYPRLLADTLIFADQPGDHAAIIVENRITVEQAAGQTEHTTSRYSANYSGQTLIVSTCPIGALCIASLVYAPLTYAFVGDSLVQQVATNGTQKPAVYGRVGRR